MQVNVARDVAVQMCDTLEGKAYTGVVNVSYMAVANEVGIFVFVHGFGGDATYWRRSCFNITGEHNLERHAGLSMLEKIEWSYDIIRLTAI